MNRSVATAALAAAVVSCAVVSTPAFAGQTFDFNTPQDYLNGPDHGGWVVDRYAPAGFAASGGHLVQTIAPPAQSSSFYNYQGMQHDLTPSSGAQKLSIDVFVDSTWTNVNAGFWGVGYDNDPYTDSTGTYPPGISAYPIIAYRKTDAANGSVLGQFYSFNYDNPLGGWTPLGTAANVNLDTFNNLDIVLTPGSGMDYYVNGALLGHTADDYTDTFSAVILNAYNFNNNYSVQWDNLSVQAIPLPTSAASGVALLGLLGLKRRNRR